MQMKTTPKKKTEGEILTTKNPKNLNRYRRQKCGSFKFPQNSIPKMVKFFETKSLDDFFKNKFSKFKIKIERLSLF